MRKTQAEPQLLTGQNAAARQHPSDVLPAEQEKAATVRSMFGAIAPRYDLLNHLLSLNRDRSWRRHAVNDLLDQRPMEGRFLDACAGTLDLAVELGARSHFRGQVVASDFSFPMLGAGVAKTRGRPITVACADALQQPFADASFDAAMVGFGVRNLSSIEAGLAEFARLIRPGGRLVVLEFTTPQWQPFRGLYLFYFRRLLPLIGKLVSRHSKAYSYLPESVLHFPEPPALAELMTLAGFQPVAWRTLTGGIVAIHTGVRR
ncbi:MAG: ubiquinone/menaquinone biosynthesis methyltransferase [Longimicrobiales bacterium]